MFATLTIDQSGVDQRDWSVDRTEDAPMNLRVFTGDNGDSGPIRSTLSNAGSRARSRERMRAAQKAVGTTFMPASPRTRATIRTAGINTPAVLTPRTSKPSPCVADGGPDTSATAQPMTPVADVRAMVASELAKIMAGFIPAAAVPPAPPAVVELVPAAASPDETLVDLYEKHLAPAERLKNEPRTVRADLSRIARFQEWLDSRALRMGIPQRAYFEVIASGKDCMLDYAAWIRSQPKGSSSASVSQAMNAIKKLFKVAIENGWLAKMPKFPCKGDINEMSASTDDEEECVFKAEPVALDEFRRMMSPEVLAGCKWPRLGNVSPALFWETVLVSHMAYGFRSQDWFSREQGKLGLLWSDVLSETKCPRLDDLHCESGWAWFLVHKTKKKAKRAKKPQKLLVPLSRRMRELIEMFRGIHPERVFPLARNGRSWCREFRGILQRAGLDDASRQAAEKPVIELSLGQEKVASFRKGCADLWADHVDGSAASYMLKHSVSEDKDKVSDVTREHYLRFYRPLKDIVPALESLPIW